jgi:hybrid cluster-associated redox disulfide protein
MGLVRSVLSKAGGAVRGEDDDGAVARLRDEVRRLEQRLRGLEGRLAELDRLTGLAERLEAHVGPLPDADQPAFSPEMTLAQVRASHPRADEVLARHHLGGCAACAVSEVETLAEGAAVHQLDLEAILTDLQALPSN